jgi:ATP-dependent DNA helicase RecG
MTTVADLLSLPESKTLEFKRDLSSLRPVLRTLVAFANTAGGTLIVGQTAAGEVVGVGDVLKEEERLASAIADSIRPALMPDLEILSYEGKALLAARVPHWRGPFYVKAEGPEKGAYIRLGSTTRRAGPEILAELQRSLLNRSFDQLACPDAGPDALDRDKIADTLTPTGRAIDGPALESLGVLIPHTGNLVPSNGGMILFGRGAVRGRLFPDARVSCARFRGLDKAEFLDRVDLEGSVLEALEQVLKFIRRNTRLAARIEGLHRQDLPEYPEVALREVLVNAVAHADYSLTGMRILVAVYSDRMEVRCSPSA